MVPTGLLNLRVPRLGLDPSPPQPGTAGGGQPQGWGWESKARFHPRSPSKQTSLWIQPPRSTFVIKKYAKEERKQKEQCMYVSLQTAGLGGRWPQDQPGQPQAATIAQILPGVGEPSLGVSEALAPAGILHVDLGILTPPSTSSPVQRSPSLPFPPSTWRGTVSETKHEQGCSVSQATFQSNQAVLSLSSPGPPARGGSREGGLGPAVRWVAEALSDHAEQSHRPHQRPLHTHLTVME